MDDDIVNDIPKVDSNAGNWRGQALCADLPKDLFFPEKAQPVPMEAKAACAACPVREPCLDYAIRMPIVVGYWGGMNVRQRRIIRREWLKSQGINREFFKTKKTTGEE